MFGWRRRGVIAPVDPLRPDRDAVDRAAAVLDQDGVVAFPTDTVYGLGCRAGRAAAIRRVYRIKGRHRGKPLVLMIPRSAPLSDYAAPLPEAAARLAEQFWPGPLTLVVPASPLVRGWKLDRGGTVAVRRPAGAVINAILDRLAAPLATTSANASGQPDSLTADEVVCSLARPADLILDGGPSPRREPSTVLDLCGQVPVILRKGAVARADLERTLGAAVRLRAAVVMFVCTGNTCRSPMAEGYLRRILPAEWRGRVTVHSSGTGALPGMPATDRAVEAARAAGADIRRHRSALLTDRLIRQADLVVAMEERHRQAVRQLVPGSVPVLLAPDGVPDPIGGEAEQYRETLELIKREMPDILTLIGGLLDPGAVRR